MANSMGAVGWGGHGQQYPRPQYTRHGNARKRMKQALMPEFSKQELGAESDAHIPGQGKDSDSRMAGSAKEPSPAGCYMLHVIELEHCLRRRHL